MENALLGIGLPGPFEMMIIIGFFGIPLLTIAIVVWFLRSRGSGSGGGRA